MAEVAEAKTPVLTVDSPGATTCINKEQ